MEEKMINAQEVAYRVGVSVQTLGSWYKFKQENPDNEYAWMLPEFHRCGNRRTRYWKESDVAAIKVFRESIPQGRNGVLGSVTQRYVKKSGTAGSRKSSMPREKKSVNYINQVRAILLQSDVEQETVEQVVELLQSELEWKMSLAV